MLYIFAGLPGVGKSTLARMLAHSLKATYLRVDTIEQVLREHTSEFNGPEGYYVAYRIAAENLRLNMAVVADTVNPLEVTREAWRAVARQAGQPFTEIEVRCSNLSEHRQRVETRRADIPGHTLPTWQAVVDRHYEPWETAPIVIDTADQSPAESFEVLRRALKI